MADFAPLDNPVWHALATAHESLAMGDRLARRYPPNVSPLAGLREGSPEAFADLRTLVETDGRVGLFTAGEVEVPSTWDVVRQRWIDQMVCVKVAREATIPIVALTPANVPEMMALAAATEPGPFLPETIRMGRYFGIRSAGGRLVAMAGQRLTLTSFVEISAVCTDSAHRGRGFAQALVGSLTTGAFEEGKTPFLHVKTENPAKAVYEKVGFAVRRQIQVTVITPSPPSILPIGLKRV